MLRNINNNNKYAEKNQFFLKIGGLRAFSFLAFSSSLVWCICCHNYVAVLVMLRSV